jgi:uncharacterized membrane protein YhaH (DUF805 family)
MDLMLLAAAFQETEDYQRGGGIIGALFGGVFMIVWLVVLVAVIAGMWKMFEKAGKPGWAAIVPIYNIIVLLEIVGRPLWWIVLFLIPCVSFVAWIIIAIDVAKAYGKDVAYGIGIALLGFIFLPMLGFGAARYVGPPARA